jgi:hypothetical protein
LHDDPSSHQYGMPLRNLFSYKSVLPSKLRLGSVGINSSVDESLRHGEYQLARTIK